MDIEPSSAQCHLSWTRVDRRGAGPQGASTAHLTLFPNPDALAEAAARTWVHQLQARRNKTVPYCVALSGGRITRGFFMHIARATALPSRTNRSPGKPDGIFENVHFFWADERCVPPTDSESNYAMARELLFTPLRIPDGQVHRVRGEATEPAALQEVMGELRAVRPFSPEGQPALDMVFLGMGEDGHTASLFPGEPEEVMNDPAVYRAVTAVKPPPRRITLGYAALAAAREVWVLISGSGKEQALKQSLPPGGRTPLFRVMSRREQTRIFTDIDWRVHV